MGAADGIFEVRGADASVTERQSPVMELVADDEQAAAGAQADGAKAGALRSADRPRSVLVGRARSTGEPGRDKAKGPPGLVSEGGPDSVRGVPGVAEAMEVFARGVAFTRSFTHPYLAERVGPLWVLRDGPRRHGPYRREEWISSDTAPEEVDRQARSQARGRFCVCALDAGGAHGAALRPGYRALAYRLERTEPLMVHDLSAVPGPEHSIDISRVRTAEMAARLAEAAGSRALLPEHLTPDAPLRAYVATVGAEPVGWVRSVVVGCATWCASVYVRPEFRRQGIARAMLGRMLQDDRTAGARASVLLASHMGAKLYASVGYARLGTLLVLSPKRDLSRGEEG